MANTKRRNQGTGLIKQSSRINKYTLAWSALALAIVGTAVIVFTHASAPYSAAGCLATDSDFRSCKDGSVEGVVSRIYLGVLGRAPDVAGLQYWSDAYLKGTPIETITAKILRSPEGIANSGDTNGVFVKNLYVRLLHRAPRDSEMTFWTSRIAKSSRAHVADSIALSKEAINSIPNQATVDLTIKTAIADVAGSSYPVTGPNSFGVTQESNFWGLTQPEISLYFDKLRSANTRWLRLYVPWGQIQPSETQYDWREFDSIVREAGKRNIKLLISCTVNAAPKWATADGIQKVGKPAKDTRIYAKFISAMVNRYKNNGVKDWQMGNEPNVSVLWLNPGGPNAADYTRYLKAGYLAAKQADSGAFVLTPGLGANGPTQNGSISGPDFIKGIYASGGKNYFDAVSYHPYDFRGAEGSDGWAEMIQVRDIMKLYGDSNKKIWATEYGCCVVNKDHPQNDLAQAARLKSAYARLASYGWGGPMFWFSFRDNSMTDDRSRFNKFGLVDKNFVEKPAFSVYQQAASGQ